MRFQSGSITAALGAFVLAGVAAPASAATASMTLFQSAVNPNPTLKSFVASASLSARMTSPISLRKTLNGKAYYQRPTLAIVFDDVPGPLKQFKELSVSGNSFVGASAKYTITPGTDDGTTSTYTLVPKQTGTRVKQIVVKVDDASTRVSEADWNYNDGSLLTVKPTYSTIDGFRVMSQQQINAKYPRYAVTGTLTLSSYQMNAPVDPSVFASAAPASH